MRMKKFLILFIIILTVISALFFFNVLNFKTVKDFAGDMTLRFRVDYEEVKNTFNYDLKYLKSNDYKKISSLIYDHSYLNDNTENEENFVTFLFSNADFEIEKTSGRYIYVNVTSHNIKNFIKDNREDLAHVITEEDLTNLVSDYYFTNEESTFENIPLMFYLDDGKVIIDYDNYDFKNAVYGGFLDEYVNSKMEYDKNLKESAGDEK